MPRPGLPHQQEGAGQTYCNPSFILNRAVYRVQPERNRILRVAAKNIPIPVFRSSLILVAKRGVITLLAMIITIQSIQDVNTHTLDGYQAQIP
jgi:hypothetical protein